MIQTLGCSPLAADYTIFTYQFVHLNIFHALANIWTFLILSFIWKISVREILTAYVISVIYGFIYIAFSSTATTTIVGFSSVIYALFGMRSLSYKIIRYNIIMILSIILTAFIPHCAYQTHLACYLIGLIYALLTKPYIKV